MRPTIWNRKHRVSTKIDVHYTLPVPDNLRVETIPVRPILEQIEELHRRITGCTPVRGSVIVVALMAYRDYMERTLLKRGSLPWRPRKRSIENEDSSKRLATNSRSRTTATKARSKTTTSGTSSSGRAGTRR